MLQIQAVAEKSVIFSLSHLIMLHIQALAEKNPTDFCLMPKGSVKKRFSLPPDVLERLAPYQIEAVQWLWDLHCESKGGIFADDMGMGKTRTVCMVYTCQYKLELFYNLYMHIHFAGMLIFAWFAPFPTY
jgi:hypothetical protein